MQRAGQQQVAAGASSATQAQNQSNFLSNAMRRDFHTCRAQQCAVLLSSSAFTLPETSISPEVKLLKSFHDLRDTGKDS